MRLRGSSERGGRIGENKKILDDFTMAWESIGHSVVMAVNKKRLAYTRRFWRLFCERMFDSVALLGVFTVVESRQIAD